MSISSIISSYNSNTHQFSGSAVIRYIQMGLRLNHIIFICFFNAKGDVKKKKYCFFKKTYRVTACIIGGGTVFLSLSGICDRNTAETFRGKFLRVTRENAIPLEEGRYFIVDVIGCNVVTNDEVVVGNVLDVFTARTDIFTVKCVDGRIMRFPFLKDAVLNVDVQNKTITVDKKRLSEIACYED